MPFDLGKDKRKLSVLVDEVPVLRQACALALRLVDAAQLSDRNKLKLHSLAHSTIDHLITIAKVIRGQPSRMSASELLELVNELESVLHDVSNAIQKYSKLSLEASLKSAAERDYDILKLEERLREVQGSILSLHGCNDVLSGMRSPPKNNLSYHIGLSVNRPQTVNTQHRSGLAIKRPETTMGAQHTEFARLLLQHPLPNRDVKVYPVSHPGVAEDAMPFLNVPPESSSSRRPRYPSGSLSQSEAPRIGSPVGTDRPPSRTLLSRLKRRPAPNLTDSITNIQRTQYYGGYGEIFWGVLMGPQGSEKVALKMLRMVNKKGKIDKAKKDFRREVGIWCSLCHPNVLPFYGTCELDDTRLFMVSPWAEGGKVLEYLQRNPNANRGELLHEMSSALEYMHSGKDVPSLVHGDVKADNVLVSRTGHALLCDFGLSNYADGLIASSGSSSNPKGTTRFMAPERLIGCDSIPTSSRPTKESDVFAFGLLMLQIYTEKLPFSDLKDAPALLKIANREVPPRPTEHVVLQRGFNEQIWELMNDCWRAHPGQRPKMKDVTWKLLWAIRR